MKIVWIIIDMQNDFCRPDGALYVPGAEKDAERISRLLRSHAAGITDIWLTRDEHQVLDISVFPGLIRKLVILKDCMSPVAGCAGWAAPVFYDAVKKGACFGSAAAWMRAADR